MRIKDITDGTSHTVFLGEQTPHAQRFDLGGHRARQRDLPQHAVPGLALRTGRSADQRPQRAQRARPRADHDGHEDTTRRTSITKSTCRSIHPPNGPFGYVDEMFSEHSGGCNVLFGDGSVRFIDEMINQLTWSAMATRAGGETVEEGR